MHRQLGTHVEAGFRLMRTASSSYQVLTPSGLVYCIEGDWQGYSVRPWFGNTEELALGAPGLAGAMGAAVEHYRWLDGEGLGAPENWENWPDLLA